MIDFLKFSSLLLIFIIQLFLKPASVYAESEFQADYEVKYNVAPDGLTYVTTNIELTNKLPNLYAKQYTLTLDTDKIGNILTVDQIGPAKTLISQENGKTEITVFFNSAVIGVGKKLFFSLKYEHPGIATKNGTIWEVNIPGINNSIDLGTYYVTLSVPESFGPAAYMTPQPLDKNRWTKEQMISGGVNIAYGQNQYFNLDLTYFLENLSHRSKSEQIAIPPDTKFQKIYLLSINPKPVNITPDQDGNWLAEYSLKALENKEVKVKMIIQVSLEARSEYIQSPIDEDLYLKPTKFWPSTHAKFQSLAAKYNTPRSIYDYVVNNLFYNYENVTLNPQRKGALSALNNPDEAVCMEFTDTFITMARAAGIPARQVIGYAYTTNSKLRPLSMLQDVLHSWPEYYDESKQTWIPVDPTWAKTTGGINYFDKFDFNHLVFAINGLSDNFPNPVGFYRRFDRPEKNINVKFNEDFNFSDANPKLNLDIKFNDNIYTGLNYKGMLIISNFSNTAVNNIPIEISMIPDLFKIVKTVNLLPPRSFQEIPFNTSLGFFSENTKGIISAKTGIFQVQKEFNVKPVFYITIFIFVILFIVSVGLWLIKFRTH